MCYFCYDDEEEKPVKKDELADLMGEEEED
jgi:hypothetical protein